MKSPKIAALEVALTWMGRAPVKSQMGQYSAARAAVLREANIPEFQKLELEVMVEALEWAMGGYRTAMTNSPEAEPALILRRTAARELIAKFNLLREG